MCIKVHIEYVWYEVNSKQYNWITLSVFVHVLRSFTTSPFKRCLDLLPGSLRLFFRFWLLFWGFGVGFLCCFLLGSAFKLDALGKLSA